MLIPKIANFKRINCFIRAELQNNRIKILILSLLNHFILFIRKRPDQKNHLLGLFIKKSLFYHFI